MRSLFLLVLYVALANCLTIRSRTNIALNNTKTPLPTQQTLPQPNGQGGPQIEEGTNADDKSNASNIIVTMITRVYPEDDEQFYEYEQVLPLKNINSIGPVKIFPLGNDTTREAGNTTVLFPKPNEQTGNITSIVDKEKISENQSNSNSNKSEIKEKQNDTTVIIPMTIFQNKNETEKKGSQQMPKQQSQNWQKGQEERNQTKNVGPSRKGGEEKQEQKNEKTRDQTEEKTEKKQEERERNSTNNNIVPEDIVPSALANNTNRSGQKQSSQKEKQRENQKQNSSKVIPIVFPFQKENHNETRVENQTSQTSNKNKSQNGSLPLPIIVPPVVPENDKNENKQPTTKNQTTTKNNETTEADIIRVPENGPAAGNNTSVEKIENGTKGLDSQMADNQEANSSKQTPSPFILPIPIDTNNTQSTQKQEKKNETQNIEQNRSKQKRNNETKIDPIVPIIPIILPNSNEHNQTANTHPNITNSQTESNQTSQNTDEIISVFPITSPEQVPPKVIPEQPQNSGQVTMVAFSCTQITNQPQKDTCKDLDGCNWLWDLYEDQCGKSGGNILAIYGPSTTQVLSKEELAHLEWSH